MSELILLVLSACWAALAAAFLTAVGRIYLHREQLPEARRNGSLPRLSLVIPARDEEANIGECLQCITRLDYPEGEFEVIVVDDNSTDATASIVDEYAARDKRIRRISAPALPEGWMGKSHACWQGAQAAAGDWLLFVDADTYLKPQAARASLDYALNKGHGFLSVIPFQRIVSAQERIVLPGVFLGFASAIDFRRVNDPDDPFAIANGQFLLFSRDAYRRVGGHEAIRSETSDDLAFARAVKRHRVSAYTLFGEHYIETRMYRSLREIWHGFAKNAMEIMHATSVFSASVDALISFGLAAGTLLPFILFSTPASTDSLLWNLSAAISVITFATLLLVFSASLRALRVPVLYLVALPVGLAMHGAIIINAWFRHQQGKREWKGRRY
ncbi:MAG: glycosyltransferase [Gammaproteobacteria bacterium]|nr:glycosyltransferase [Gammaproteobacteria bacterium]NNL99825.1 glycosyltransferase [Gammaproteobacteria bacterium]